MRDFLNFIEAVVEKNHLGHFFAFTDFWFGAMVQSSFAPNFPLLFRSCRHAGALGVE